MLTGVRPFSASSEAELFLRVVDSDEVPQAPSARVSSVPSELDALVLRAISRSRDARFATAHEFLDALRPFGAGDVSVTSALPLCPDDSRALRSERATPVLRGKQGREDAGRAAEPQETPEPSPEELALPLRHTFSRFHWLALVLVGGTLALGAHLGSSALSLPPHASGRAALRGVGAPQRIRGEASRVMSPSGPFVTRDLEPLPRMERDAAVEVIIPHRPTDAHRSPPRARQRGIGALGISREF